MSNIEITQSMSSLSAVATQHAPSVTAVQVSDGASEDLSPKLTRIVTVLNNTARSALPAENKGSAATSLKSVDLALKTVNSALGSSDTNLSFSVDPSSNRTVIEVKDKETGDTILKLPGDAILKIAANIESLKGILFDAAL